MCLKVAWLCANSSLVAETVLQKEAWGLNNAPSICFWVVPEGGQGLRGPFV